MHLLADLHQFHVAELEAVQNPRGNLLRLDSRDQVLDRGVVVVKGPVFRIGNLAEEAPATHRLPAQLVDRIRPGGGVIANLLQETGNDFTNAVKAQRFQPLVGFHLPSHQALAAIVVADIKFAVGRLGDHRHIPLHGPVGH